MCHKSLSSVYWISLIVFLLLLFFEHCYAIIEKEHIINTDERIYQIARFAFTKGGTATVNIKPIAAYDLHALVCTESEVNVFQDTYRTVAGLCSQHDKVRCSLKLTIPSLSNDSTNTLTYSGDNEANGTIVIGRDGMVFFYLLNCPGSPIQTTASYIFVNPDGQHLSVEHQPLPLMYTIVGAISLLLCVAWMINWFVYRLQQTHLHRVISLFPLLKLLWCSGAAVYWFALSKLGTLHIALKVPYYVLYFASIASFYGMVLVISRGWFILHGDLKYDRWLIPGSAFLMGVCLSLASLFSGYFLLMTFLLYILILLLVFKYINNNLVILNGLTSVPDHDPSLDQKRAMFGRLKIVMIGYITCVMGMVMVEVLLLDYYPWISETFYQSFDLCLFLFIAITFRLRESSVYYKIDPNSAITHPQKTKEEEQKAAEKYKEAILPDTSVVEMGNMTSTLPAVVVTKDDLEFSESNVVVTPASL